MSFYPILNIIFLHLKIYIYIYIYIYIQYSNDNTHHLIKSKMIIKSEESVKYPKVVQIFLKCKANNTILKDNKK